MSNFRRNFFTLVSGSAFAQIFTIAIGPLLTRLYSPAEFGILATYSAIVAVLLSVSTGKYELSIVMPDHDQTALETAVLACLWAVCATTLFSVVLLFFMDSDTLNTLVSIPDFLLPWLPVSLLLVSLTMVTSQWLIRTSQYKSLSRVRMIQSFSAGSTQLLCGSLGAPHGLVIGTIAGQFCAIAEAWLGGGRAIGNHFLAKRLRGVRTQFKRYIKFPAYQVPTGFVETLSGQLPVFALGIGYGASVAGYYSLAERLVRLPAGLIGQSVGEVFRQEATQSLRDSGSARPLFMAVLMKLAIGSIIPAFLFALIAPDLFAFVFGEDWRVAGTYARILTPMFWMSFITAPLSVIFFIAERQEIDLALQFTMLIVSSIILFIGNNLFTNPEPTLFLFSTAYFIKYCLELSLAYRFSQTPQT